MPNIFELTVPTNYPACIGCMSRQELKSAATKYFEEGHDIDPVKPDDVASSNYDLEFSYMCLPQLRKLAKMSIHARKYLLHGEGRKTTRGGKPDERKTFAATVSCDAQVAGEPLV